MVLVLLSGMNLMRGFLHHKSNTQQCARSLRKNNPTRHQEGGYALGLKGVQRKITDTNQKLPQFQTGGSALFEWMRQGLEDSIAQVSNGHCLNGYEVLIHATVTPSFTRPYVKFNVEQYGQYFAWNELLQHVPAAAAVWDFSLSQANLWRSQPAYTKSWFLFPGGAVPPVNISNYIPMLWTMPLSELQTALPEPLDDDPEAIDVCFYGDMNPSLSHRRHQMRAVFARTGLKVMWGQFEAGSEERRICEEKSRVMLLVHSAEGNAQGLRLVQYMTAGRCFVSETTRDPEVDEFYATSGGAYFASKECLPDLVSDLIHTGRWRECGRKGRAFLSELRNSYPQELHDAIDKLPCMPE